MTAVALKNDFHKLIDSIDNIEKLNVFYNVISENKNTTDGMLWNGLTKAQQQELLLADAESEDEANHISHQQIMKKHRKWLKK